MIKCCPFCGSHHFRFDGDDKFHCCECERDFSDIDYKIEEIRHEMSALLSGHTEENPLIFQYPVTLDDKGYFGISELEKPRIISAFEDGEGIIWFNVEFAPKPLEFDCFDYDMLMILLGEIVIDKR